MNIIQCKKYNAYDKMHTIQWKENNTTNTMYKIYCINTMHRKHRIWCIEFKSLNSMHKMKLKKYIVQDTIKRIKCIEYNKLNI